MEFPKSEFINRCEAEYKEAPTPVMLKIAEAIYNAYNAGVKNGIKQCEHIMNT